MNELEDFLSKWEETKSVQALLDSKLDLPEAETVQLHLSSLPPSRQEEIKNVLEEVAAAMALHLENAEVEASELRSQINQQTQNVNACLSYNKSQRPSSK